MFRRFLLRAFCCVVLALPAACSTIGGGGPQALEAASPLDADPHALVVALTKPAALSVGDGDLALSLSWAVPGRDEQEERAGLQVARRDGTMLDRSSSCFAPPEFSTVASTGGSCTTRSS